VYDDECCAQLQAAAQTRWENVHPGAATAAIVTLLEQLAERGH